MPYRAVQAVARLREERPRRLAYAVIALIFAVLCLVPRHYVARVKLLPQDSNTAGLSAILGSLGGGLQNFASLLGNHQSVEVYLIIGRSHDVLNDVVTRLHLVERWGYADRDRAEIRVSRKVDIHSLPGGVLEIEAQDWDPAFARKLADTFASAIRDRFAKLGAEHTAQKKAVVTDRLAQASQRLIAAQSALNKFRETNKLAEPQAQLGEAVAMKASLQGRLQAKLVELDTARQFATSENMQVKTIQAEVASLRSRIANAEIAEIDQGSPNLAGIAFKSAEYLDLYRNVQFAEALVEVYTRYQEEVTVEEMIADTNANAQIIEEAYVDPERQFNILPMGLLGLIVLVAFYTEYYVPATKLHRRQK